MIYHLARWSCFIGNGGVEQRYESYDVLARDLSMRWQSATNTLPAGAIQGGTIVGLPSYICQARIKGGTQYNTHIGKLWRDNGVWKCFIGNGGVEQAFGQYRALVGASNTTWAATTSTLLPVTNVSTIWGGNVEDSGDCFVCRAYHSGGGYDNTHVGKACRVSLTVTPCFIGNGGVEQRYDSYEIIEIVPPRVADAVVRVELPRRPRLLEGARGREAGCVVALPALETRS